MSARWRRRVLLLLLVSVAYLIGSRLQQELGLSFTLDGLEQFRRWVEGLGWWGPSVFLLLVIFRLFIGLSSHLVLILGGLAFGAVGGIFWGSLGILASALVLYCLARVLGADWVQRRFGDQYTAMLARIRRLGAMAVFAVSAHPVGLLTPIHLAAGLVGLGVGRFALAVVLAAPIRTAPYAILGTAILDMSLEQSLWIAAAMAVLFFVPLVFPSVRAWIFGRD